jgi:hypothetical protein
MKIQKRLLASHSKWYRFCARKYGRRIQRVGKEELYKIFDEVPIEPDTRILAKAYGEKDSILFRIEEWSWDGIYGKTIVISSKQCSTLVTEEDIKTKFEIKGETTFKKVGQYYFLNYDFSI